MVVLGESEPQESRRGNHAGEDPTLAAEQEWVPRVSCPWEDLPPVFVSVHVGARLA